MLTIAIAEDNAAEREGLKQQVHKLGHQVLLTAVNGYDLLQQLLKLPTQKLPHILLLDIKMPRINGLIVTTYCAYKYPSIRIIAVSSHTNDTLITEIITEGASAFITKYFLTPNAFIYSDNYGTTNVLQLAVEAVQNGQFFIDKLLINYPENIRRTVATSTIIAKQHAYLKPKHKEFVILNAAGLSLAEVAVLMHTSANTLKDYNKILCKQFGVDNHHQLVHACFAHGIVKLAVYYDSTMVA
jgi:DNA-binding NarL/FixJ family response regulator